MRPTSNATTDPYGELSRRERQIMSVLYGRGSATAAEVQRRLPDPPSYSAVRSALALLEERGVVRHEREGRRYVYFPTQPREEVRERALDHLLRTFFRGSPLHAAAALLARAEYVDEAEYEELKRLLDEAREEGPAGRA